jgi:hypothetical protein
MNFSNARIVGNASVLALYVGITGLAACRGGRSSGNKTPAAASVQMGGARQGVALSLSAASAAPIVSTLAGSAVAAASGVVDGAGTAATFDSAVAATTDGINLYVVDSGNNKIRKITPSSGTLSAMTSANAVIS